MNNKQIIMLGGGGSYDTREDFLEDLRKREVDNTKYKRWKDWIAWSLEDKYEFISPDFPCRDNADFEAWKIWFEKYFPLFRNNLIIVAHSLGTIFIIKYLLENKFDFRISELHLVAPIISNDFQPETDIESTSTFTFDFKKVSELEGKVEKIVLWHSEDDNICDIKNSNYLKEQLPGSLFNKFVDRGHFLQSTFVELFDHLR